MPAQSIQQGQAYPQRLAACHVDKQGEIEQRRDLWRQWMLTYRAVPALRRTIFFSSRFRL
jgi:hypothetical protein